MTCIIAALHQRGVIVAADSRASCANLQARDTPKIRRRGAAIVGAAGDGPLCELALHAKCTPYRDGPLPTWLREQLSPAVWTAAGAKHGEQIEVFIIAATATEIAAIDDDGSVYLPRDPWHAIGSGAEYALGAMYASEGGRDLQLRMRRAAMAAARYADGVGEPWTWLECRR